MAEGIRFHSPGAYHQARWMAKRIYCLKIFLFRNQFKLTKLEESALERICTFIIKIYIISWSTATNVSEAPYNDFKLIQRLNQYKKDDMKIAEACLLKFLNHLWYMNKECLCFSIFDERIPLSNRKEMASKLLAYEESNKLLLEDVFENT